jgi:hypothetical protein
VGRTQLPSRAVERIGLVSRRLVISGIAAAAIAGAVVPAFASTGASATPDRQICIAISDQYPNCLPDVVGTIGQTISQQQGPATIDTSDGVGVGVELKGQPVASAHVSPDGQVCVGISLELPACTPGSIVGATNARTQQSLPITVTHDTSNGVSVGVRDGNAPVGGASVTPDGQACAGLGEDIPVCTPPVLDAVGPIGG